MMEIRESSREIGGFEMIARLVVAALLTLFTTGVVIGFTQRALEVGHLPGPKGLVVVPITLMPLLGALWLARPAMRNHDLKDGLLLPKSPRMRRAQVSLYVCAAFSFGLGLAFYYLQRTGKPHDHDLMAVFTGSDPIGVTPALVAIAGYLVAMGLSLRWLRNIDEHERGAYNFGASLALHAYFMAAPVWWLAWRAGLAPAVSGTGVYWLMAAVWTAGWFWRRYR